MLRATASGMDPSSAYSAAGSARLLSLLMDCAARRASSVICWIPQSALRPVSRPRGARRLLRPREQLHAVLVFRKSGIDERKDGGDRGKHRAECRANGSLLEEMPRLKEGLRNCPFTCTGRP